MQFCRLQARPQLDNLAQRTDTTAIWDDLVLSAREKTTLKAISTPVQSRPRSTKPGALRAKASGD